MARSSAKVLWLVPTEFEFRSLAPRDLLPPEAGAAVALCGFGPVAAAARAAQLIGQYRPLRVVLLGIAGTYDAALLPVGTARCFPYTALEGVGAGWGERLVPGELLGFPSWPEKADRASPLTSRGLPLAGLPTQAGPSAQTRSAERTDLLTVCAASATEEQARWRREQFPRAVAEDMEGFAVALACHMQGVEVTVIRGISNEAGNRDIDRWQTDEALRAAAELAAAAMG